MARFEVQIRNLSQMGPRPKIKIKTIARTKLGVYKVSFRKGSTNTMDDALSKKLKEIFMPFPLLLMTCCRESNIPRLMMLP